MPVFFYFIQAYVSSKTMPQEQRQMGYMMMIVSPIMIIWISLQASSNLAYIGQSVPYS